MHSIVQISRVVVVKREDTRSPTMLTVAYRGWWQTPKVHLRLALDPVPRGAQQLRGAGRCELQQRFSRGRGPMLRVKGPARKLVVRLYAGRSLRTQAEITLGDLLSRTAEGVTQVPFEVKEGGKIEKAFIEMEQISPNPTPLPPPLLPIAFTFLSQDIPPGQTVFPPAREPTPFRLKQLVEDMYGPAADRTDWSKPFTLDPESLAEEEAAPPATADASHGGTQSLDAGACTTDTDYDTADDAGSASDYDTADDAGSASDYDTADDAGSASDYDTADDAGSASDYDTGGDSGSASDYETGDDDASTQDQGTSPPEEVTSHGGEQHGEAFRREAESSTVLFQPLPLPRLRSADRRDILGRRWLSDDVMDLAQDILQTRFPETRGLYACGAAFTLPPLQPGATSLFLQVVNRSAPQRLDSMADYGRLAGTHWLLLSSYGARRSGQLAVYDSMYNDLSASTTALVEQLQELHTPLPGAIMRPVQRQNDGYSCGLFALAFAFSIAVGQDPCAVRYDRASMAPHLVMCLERGVVQPFPSVPAGRGR